jgi:hypothetical protein
VAFNAKLTILTRRLDAMEGKEKLVAAIYVGCNDKGHIVEDCPLLAGSQAMDVNTAFARPSGARNDPYVPTYNPGWCNHPNFTWRAGPNQEYQLAPYQRSQEQ